MELVVDRPAAPAAIPDPETLLGEIIARHRPMLLAHTARLTNGDRDWAEDVVQETFVRAWRHIDRLTAERGSVHGWLRRVAHNLVMDGYRMARSRPHEVEFEGCPPPRVADGTERVADQMLVTELLAGLPEEHRVALIETYLHDRTAGQAAEQLGVPVGTVKSRVFYGLRRLRATIEADLLAG
jgi:RNA polymerase sigma-70 factor, ECF subfamily